VLRRWLTQLEAWSGKPEPLFAPWLELAKLTNFSSGAKPLLAKFAAQPTANQVLVEALSGCASNSLADAAQAYNSLFKTIDQDWQAALAAATTATQLPPAALPNPDREALRQVLYAEGSPLNLPTSEAEAILQRPLTDGTAPFRNKIAELNWTHPGAPQR